MTKRWRQENEPEMDLKEEQEQTEFAQPDLCLRCIRVGRAAKRTDYRITRIKNERTGKI